MDKLDTRLKDKVTWKPRRCNLIDKHVVRKMGVDPETDKVTEGVAYVVRYYYSEYHNEIVARITRK